MAKETANQLQTTKEEREVQMDIKEGSWREKNKNNTILYGLAENVNETHFIDNICDNLRLRKPIKVFRIGVNAGPKPRPIKINFNYKQDNFEFYKAYIKGMKTNNWNYNIGYDLTKVQQNNLKKVKEELKLLPSEEQKKKKITLKNGDFKITNKNFSVEPKTKPENTI